MLLIEVTKYTLNFNMHQASIVRCKNIKKNLFYNNLEQKSSKFP